jgi:hypothetical protein
VKSSLRERIRPWIALLGVLALAVTILAPFVHHHGLADEHVSCPVCQIASHHGAVLPNSAAVPAPNAGAVPIQVSEASLPGFAPLFALPDPRGPPLA